MSRFLTTITVNLGVEITAESASEAAYQAGEVLVAVVLGGGGAVGGAAPASVVRLDAHAARPTEFTDHRS